jgi:signal transduction histidine kinase
LRQILSNLLANSLDACPRGATIRVEANPASDPRNPVRTGVRISVADTGCGIRSDHIESIFEPFFTTKKDTGTGLGLWVSRELVEKHGGSLRVRSRTSDGKSGTVFSIFLPAEGRRSRVDRLSPSVADSVPMEQAKATLPNGLTLQ